MRIPGVCDDPGSTWGKRVLVDRIWPRGLTKEDAHLDEWLKAVAPSTDLRKWYAHDPDKYADFARRYREELAEGEAAEALAELKTLAGKGAVTLLTATKDLDHSQAAVLAGLLTPG